MRSNSPYWSTKYVSNGQTPIHPPGPTKDFKLVQTFDNQDESHIVHPPWAFWPHDWLLLKRYSRRTDFRFCCLAGRLANVFEWVLKYSIDSSQGKNTLTRGIHSTFEGGHHDRHRHCPPASTMETACQELKLLQQRKKQREIHWQAWWRCIYCIYMIGCKEGSDGIKSTLFCIPNSDDDAVFWLLSFEERVCRRHFKSVHNLQRVA